MVHLWRLLLLAILTAWWLGSPGRVEAHSFSDSPTFYLNTKWVASAPNESGLFALNTVGATPTLATLTGTVRDQSTNSVISGALVVLVPVEGGAVTSSNGLGQWSMLVPGGYGYQLTVSAQNHQRAVVSSLTLSPGQTITRDVLLTPNSGSYSLRELAPQTAVSLVQVEQGGTAFRHFLVWDETLNQAAPGVMAEVSGLSASLQSDAEGELHVGIPTTSVGNGQPGATATFSVISLGGQPLPPEQQVEWTVQTVSRPVYMSWCNKEWIKLGVSFFNTTFKNGSIITLWENGIGSSTGDSISIGRNSRSNIGAEFDFGYSAGIHGNIVEVGSGTSIGMGGNYGIVSVDNYTFPKRCVTDLQRQAEWILFADGNLGSTDALIVRILGLLKVMNVDNNNVIPTFREGGLGTYAAVEADATADISVGGRELNLGATIEASFGTNASIGWQVISESDNKIRYGIGLSGELSFNGSAGLYVGHPRFRTDPNQNPNIPHDQDYTEFPARLGFTGDISGSIGFETASVYQGESLKKLLFTSNRRYAPFNWLGNGYEIKTTYTIEAQPAILEQIRQHCGLFRTASDGAIGMIFSNPAASENLVDLLDAVAMATANDPAAVDVSYVVERSTLEHIDDIDIEVAGQLGFSALSGKLGTGTGFEQARGALMERGVLVNGQHLASQKQVVIPTFHANYQKLAQEITDFLPEEVRQQIADFSLLTSDVPQSWQPMGDNGSAVQVPAGAFPEDFHEATVANWGWYGPSARANRSSLPSQSRTILEKIRERTEEAQGMRYGIGGFYQSEPVGMTLLDTAIVRIAYQDAECQGFSETELALFREDKANHDWIYQGGVVDTVANTVTAPFTVLGCYTLAPRLPWGEIPISATPGTLPADSLHTCQLVIGPVLMNDGGTAPAGTRITVAVDRGALLAADLDSTRAGLQVAMDNQGMAQLTLRSGLVAFAATVEANSMYGSAAGSGQVQYTDTSPPPVPQNLVLAGAGQSLQVAWDPVSVPDLAGYRVYYDTDNAAPPYHGHASVWGSPSPVETGLATAWTLTGLSNDSLYHVCVTALDVTGVESGYSQVLSLRPALPAVASLSIALVDGGLRLDWGAVPLASGYRVYRAAQAYAPWGSMTLVAETTDQTWLDDSDLESAWYRVVAVSN